MTERTPGSIPRRLEASVFDELRAEMLTQVQALTAHQWTDYNLHDPGVTILEQLAFALSDLNYRSSYPVDTLLANRHDEIDLPQHGLFAPEDAFACRPVCERDLQKALLNDIPELAYVKVQYCNAIPGLLDLFMTPHSRQINRHALLPKVQQVYHRHRNLCENLRCVTLIRHASAHLTGVIDVHRDVLPEQALASIVFVTQRFLLGDVDRIDYDTQYQLSGGMPYDGPRMSRHFISDDDLAIAEKPRAISALIEKLITIDGVLSVRNLAVTEMSGQNPQVHRHFLPAACSLALYLEMPAFSQDTETLVLQQQGATVELDKKRFLHEYQSLIDHYNNQRDLSSMPSKKTRWPVRSRTLTDYSSVQSHFPNNYGINAFGVPSYSDMQRRAQARQLQGYLLLYDQLMSDHLQLLDHIKVLFSTDIDHIPHHPASQVTDANAFDLAALYRQPQGPDFLASEFYDSHHLEHKRHILDYLLAINGRDKSHYANDLFNPYLDRQERYRFQLQCRKVALENVHNWAEHRGGGANLENTTGMQTNCVLEKRLRLLLGAPTESLSLLPETLTALQQARIEAPETVNASQRLLSDLVCRKIASPVLDSVDEESVTLPYRQVTLAQSRETVRIYVRQARLNLASVWPTLAHYGASLERYRIAQVVDRRTADLLVNLAAENQPDLWYYLGSFKAVKACAEFANQLRCYLLNECQRLSGLHLIEHLPLLPETILNQDAHEPSRFIEQSPFYCHQLTAVLPDYTLRNQHQKFRHYLRGQIQQECPAHLHCHLLWLSDTDMQQFEKTYRHWQRSLHSDASTVVDQFADALSAFLCARLPPELTQGGQ